MPQKNLSSKHFPKGSILIWTVLLGVLLTTAFLFFILRFGGGRAFQVAVMQQNNQSQYVQSFMDYLKALPIEDLNTYKIQTIYFDEGQITGTVTNEVERIEGLLDVDQTIIFSNLEGEVVIFWNRCDLDGSGMLEVNQGDTPLSDQCGPVGVEYDQLLTADVSLDTPLEITALGEPLNYAIESTTPDQLILGNEWTADLQGSLPYGRKINLSERFVPSS